jgi:signal transduction histidine kinase
MFGTARLRLTAWYLLTLTVVCGLMSFALYGLLLQVQQSDLHTAHQTDGHFLARILAHESTTLAYQIIAVDAAILVLAAIGAYLLAGRTLRPIEVVVDRQRRFAAAASHEMRTPLTALRGNVEVALLKQRTPQEYENVLRRTLATTERLSALVQDLTLLARPTTDAQLIHWKLLDLAQVVQLATDDIRPLADGKSQVLSVDLDGSLPVQGDALKLRQVVVNLLDNAVRYAPEGSTIELTGKRDRTRAILQILDTGPGIAPEHLTHLFEPFYQVGSSGGPSGHVGLGLALADWVVRAHGGQLEVKSALGVGTVFTLSLAYCSPLSG